MAFQKEEESKSLHSLFVQEKLANIYIFVHFLFSSHGEKRTSHGLGCSDSLCGYGER